MDSKIEGLVQLFKLIVACEDCDRHQLRNKDDCPTNTEIMASQRGFEPPTLIVFIQETHFLQTLDSVFYSESTV